MFTRSVSARVVAIVAIAVVTTAMTCWLAIGHAFQQDVVQPKLRTTPFRLSVIQASTSLRETAPSRRTAGLSLR